MTEQLAKMKLGRRKNYLRKCVMVSDLLKQYENTTTIRSRIFKEHIQPVILCSYQQFNNMLNEPNPRKQLEEIEQNERS